MAIRALIFDVGALTSVFGRRPCWADQERAIWLSQGRSRTAGVRRTPSTPYRHDGLCYHMVGVTAPATTVLLGRKNYQGFGGYWPTIAGDESADPRDRAFARWLNAVEKIVFS